MRYFGLFAWLAMAWTLLAEDNTALVVDAQSVTIGGPLTIGATGTNNTLMVLNGGKLTNTVGTVGSEATASNNGAIVDGAGSVWNIEGSLTIGKAGKFNTLLVTNQGLVASSAGYVAGCGYTGASNNQAIVSGPGSSWAIAKELDVGCYAANCMVKVGEGGYVEAAACRIGGSFDALANVLLVSGVDSRLVVRHDLRLGDYGVSNSLRVLDGASADCELLSSGRLTFAKQNYVLVDGSRSALRVSQALEIGGIEGQLLVLNGASLTNGAARIGPNAQARLEGPSTTWRSSGLEFQRESTNSIANGAVLIVTNETGTAELNVSSASLHIQNGIVITDLLVVTNVFGSSSPAPDFRLNGGLMDLGQVILDPPLYFRYPALQVGDGTNIAQLVLRGSTNRISKAAIVVAQKSVLQGTGVLSGPLTNNGTVALSPAASLETYGLLWNRGALQFELSSERSATLPFLITRTNASLGGSLVLRLATNSTRLAHPLTLIKWNSRTGEFQNAPDAARVPLGAGTVRVDYAPDGLYISDYQEDLDGDGIDDLWALTYFGHTPLTEAEKLLDPDGDGSPTWAEAVAGTNPFDPASVFKIISLSPNPDFTITLRFACVPGKRYRVWTSSNGTTWVETQNPVFTRLSDSEAEWMGPLPASIPSTLYRLSVQ